MENPMENPMENAMENPMENPMENQHFPMGFPIQKWQKIVILLWRCCCNTGQDHDRSVRGGNGRRRFFGGQQVRPRKSFGGAGV